MSSDLGSDVSSETSGEPRLTAVVLAYGAEPLLRECVEAILASAGLETDVVLVDNGCTTDAVGALEGTPGLTILRPATNTGFAGGCNLGVGHTGAPLVASRMRTLFRCNQSAVTHDVLHQVVTESPKYRR